MAATSQVVAWRPLPGRADAFIGQVGMAKGIHERLGARVNVAQTVMGGEPMTLIYMMSFDSGVTFGAFLDALERDGEWQQFWTTAMGDPTAEMVSSALYSAVEGL